MEFQIRISRDLRDLVSVRTAPKTPNAIQEAQARRSGCGVGWSIFNCVMKEAMGRGVDEPIPWPRTSLSLRLKTNAGKDLHNGL